MRSLAGNSTYFSVPGTALSFELILPFELLNESKVDFGSAQTQRWLVAVKEPRPIVVSWCSRESGNGDVVQLQQLWSANF